VETIWLKNKNFKVEDIFLKDLEEILARYQTQNAKIEKKWLKDLKGESFYIKNYQRGYRWTKTEVEELLTDIDALAEKEGYCLQPLVVTSISNEKAARKLERGEIISAADTPNSVYELIDGQQRLTTLHLIKNYLGGAEYDIYYELVRGVDEDYIKKAKGAIEEWFKKKDKNKKSSFVQKLDNLFFIWYEVLQGSSENIFNSVNDGKVPLTNAELFKALLLDENSQLNKEEQVKIAYEWDKIESNLRDDDFWAFISNDQSDQKTRIDYLLDIYAKKLYDDEKELCDKGQQSIYAKIGDLDFYKERFSFLIAQRYKDETCCGAKTIWEKIVKVYDKLYSWYKDDELYHTIGFLVACEEKSKGSKATASEWLCDLYREYNEQPLSVVRKVIKEKICERYFTYKDKEGNLHYLEVEQVKYAYDKETEIEVGNKELKAILLFSNIYAGCFGFIGDNEQAPFMQRFPFRIYKNMKWDIEHIKPKALRQIDRKKYKGKKGKADFKNDIQSARDALLTEGNFDDTQKLAIKNGTDDDIMEVWNNYKVNPDHELSNLVLLDSSTNRQYGNAFFCRKRNDVIKFDVEGRFIPLCTKRAFLKYYSKGEFFPTSCWTTEEDEVNDISPTIGDNSNKSDKRGYREYLEDMFKTVHGWRKI